MTDEVRLHRVIGQSGGVFDRGQNVFTLKRRIVRQNLVDVGTMTEQFQDIGDSNPLSAQAGMSAALSRLNCDPIQQRLGVAHQVLPVSKFVLLSQK